ncbi:uncharacterized protein P174DRAFT_380984, partial [Aspergillus novofumigatus IBT 16806]
LASGQRSTDSIGAGDQTAPGFGHPSDDAARRPLESRNHGWDGRLPPFLKRGPTEGTCAPPVTERRPAWQGRSGRRRARTPPEVTRLSPST